MNTWRRAALAAVVLVLTASGARSAEAQAGGAPAAPDMPVGLWRNTDDGMVIRIAPCDTGAGLCGVAVGMPTTAERTPPADACGATIMRGFVWQERPRRWDGKIRPPDADRELGGQLSLGRAKDGTPMLTLRARVLLISKTMTFAPFSGRVLDGCRVE